VPQLVQVRLRQLGVRGDCGGLQGALNAMHPAHYKTERVHPPPPLHAHTYTPHSPHTSSRTRLHGEEVLMST